MPPTGHPALTGTVTAPPAASATPTPSTPSGTINVAGGKHINGASDVTGNPHTCDPSGSLRPTTATPASSQGLQNCTGCHTNFGGPSGAAAGLVQRLPRGGGPRHLADRVHLLPRHDRAQHGHASTRSSPLHRPSDSAGNGDTPRRGGGRPPEARRSPPPSRARSPARTATRPRARSAVPVVPTNVDHVDGQPARPLRAIAITGQRHAVLQRDLARLLGDLLPRQLHGREDPRCRSGPSTSGGAHLHLLPQHADHEHRRALDAHGLDASTAPTATTGSPPAPAALDQRRHRPGPALHVNGVKNVPFANPDNGIVITGSGTATALQRHLPRGEPWSPPAGGGTTIAIHHPKGVTIRFRVTTNLIRGEPRSGQHYW